EVALADGLRIAIGRLAALALLLLFGLRRRLRDEAHALAVARFDVRHDANPSRRHTLIDQLIAYDVRAIVRALARVRRASVGKALDDDRLVAVDELGRDAFHLRVAGR